MRQVVTVLYLVDSDMEATARGEMEGRGALPRRGARGRDWMVLAALNRTYQLRIITDVIGAVRLLSEHYFNFVVVDSRRPNGAARAADCFTESLARAFMERVHYSGDPERMYPLARIIAVLDADECMAAQAFELGKFRIGGFVVNPFDGSLFEQMTSLQADPSGLGKAAICLAGGGVEGFLFEIGVLKALNAHLQNRSVTDVDIFCGISAGSILAAFLANGVEPEEVDAAMNGTHEDPTLDPVKPSIIFDPAIKEYFARVFTLARRVPILSFNELISNLIKTVPAGFFRGQALKDFVEKQLTRGGRTNDFRQLKRELYIGATDQDQSTHVIFGQGQWADVPISTAVRASTALTPFFPSEKIRGRYFVDGQYTRTSNFHYAVERGAKLVIVIDPLIPLKIDKPGYVAEKGGVFAGLQALKSVIHTRFMHSIRNAAANNPDVDFVLFKPEGDDMRLMSGSPMKYNIRTEIVNMAYRCTVRKVQRDFEILGRTFAKHGYRLQRYPRLRAMHNAV